MKVCGKGDTGGRASGEWDELATRNGVIVFRVTVSAIPTILANTYSIRESARKQQGQHRTT
jgi:hypothetical protein